MSIGIGTLPRFRKMWKKFHLSLVYTCLWVKKVLHTYLGLRGLQSISITRFLPKKININIKIRINMYTNFF